MIRSSTAVILSLLISPILSLDTQAQSAVITEQEAHAIGVNAYLYFYSLLSMDITRKQSTNIEPGKEFGKGPMNMFVNVPEYPPANFKGVVRSNFDTLYSIAWLDLTKEPVVISVPDTNGRYYLLPMLDMWTDVFASPGWRTTGTQAGTFLVTPPGWRPDLRDRFIDEFKLPKDTRRPRLMSGSLAVPRRMVRKTMMPSIKSRPATRSRCFPNLGSPPSPSRSKSIRALT